MKRIALLAISLIIANVSFAQLVIEAPIAVDQTHQDLNIDFVRIYKDSTVFELSVENKLAQNGWFCADKKIYIETLTGHQRFNILNARGIPRCPNVYSFKRVGEKLHFTLIFPAIPQGTNRLNLVEDCDKSCFKFLEIILDNKLNADFRIYSKGVELYAANKLDQAIDCFSKVVEVIPSSPSHIYGYSYYNLIKIYNDKKDKEKVLFWLEQLEKSPLINKQYFINSLQKEGLQLK